MHFAVRALLIFIAGRSGYALDPATPLSHYRITRWENSSGLPQNAVGSLAQTADGYLWFGTQAGLARFDGKRFTHYFSATHPGLADSLILGLTAGRDGALWVQTPRGLQRYWKGKFEAPVEAGDGRRLVTARLMTARDGSVWANTRSGLLRYRNGHVRRWKRQPGGPLPAALGALREDRQGQMWLATPEAIFRLENEEFRRQPATLPAGRISDIGFTDDSILVMVRGVGIATVDRATGQTVSVRRPAAGKEFGTSMLVDRSGQAWVYGGDAEVTRISGERTEALAANGPVLADLLFEDREGNIWAAGLANGVVQVADALVRNLHPAEAKRETVWSLFEDTRGTLWIGMETGLASYRGGELRWDGAMAGRRVAAFAESDGKLLTATSKGVTQLGSGGAPRPAAADTTARGIVELRPGLFAWTAGGLSLSDGLRGTKRALDGGDRRSWSPVLMRARDGDGYWVAGQGRVGRLGPNGELSLKSFGELGEVTGVAEDGAARGVLWLCEMGGKLWRYEEGRLTAIPLRRELLVMDAVSLVDDGLGRLWMGTSNGILVFDKQELVTAAEGRKPGADGRRIGQAHGMRNAECNTLTNGQSAIRTRDGWVWFATEGGAAGIDPRRFGANPHVPEARVEEVVYDGEARDVEAGPVEVGPGDGGVEFRYTGVTMASPELVRFRYKLEGFDRGWVDAGDRRSAFYTNLPPGRYRFVLEAINSDGRAGTAVTTGFRLRPWFYQTLWFQVLCVFGALAVAAGFYRWRIGSVRERNAELERAVAARTAELEVAVGEARKAAAMKSEFLATMSHEIRTPMHGVIGMSSLLLSMPLPAEAAEYAGAIRSSAGALLTVINDILDFSKVESGVLELERAPFGLEQCVEEALDVMAPSALEKGLDLAYWIDEDVPQELVGDAGRVRQVLLNVVGNAVKFTAAGAVAVTVTRGERAGLLRFQVRDTGIGIPADRLDRLFTPFTQVDSSTTRHYGGTGLGLAICRRLCELMGGTIGVESEPGRGSTFWFTIGLEEEAAAGADGHGEDQAEAWLKGKRVLLAMRECPTREVITRLLGGAGAVVETVSTAAGARARAQEQPGFDVAIAGPEMAGARLAARQVALQPGNTRWDGDGAEGILAKPVKRRLLLAVLREVLEGVAAAPPETARRGQEFDPQLARRAPMRILLAEDNEVNQRLALRVLGKMGYRADVAKNGLEVLAALRSQDYDLVLMDIQMPRMDGFETTRRIREEWPGAEGPQVVAMTANAIAGDREACLEAGMNDYVSKPIEIAALQAAIERAHQAAVETKE